MGFGLEHWIYSEDIVDALGKWAPHQTADDKQDVMQIRHEMVLRPGQCMYI